MTETFCTIANARFKAGANVSAAITDANVTTVINQAEAAINAEIKLMVSGTYINLISDFANMAAGVKEIFKDAASSHAAMALIIYDVGGYGASEAQTMIDVNYQRFTSAMDLLKTKEVMTYLRSFNT